MDVRSCLPVFVVCITFSSLSTLLKNFALLPSHLLFCLLLLPCSDAIHQVISFTQSNHHISNIPLFNFCSSPVLFCTAHLTYCNIAVVFCWNELLSPLYSSFPDDTPVYTYIYMYTTLENVHKSLVKSLYDPLHYFLPLSFSRVLCRSIVMSTLLSLNQALFLLYLCCHRILRTSTCCIVYLHCRHVFLPLFLCLCIMQKKKL